MTKSAVPASGAAPLSPARLAQIKQARRRSEQTGHRPAPTQCYVSATATWTPATITCGSLLSTVSALPMLCLASWPLRAGLVQAPGCQLVGALVIRVSGVALDPMPLHLMSLDGGV